MATNAATAPARMGRIDLDRLDPNKLGMIIFLIGEVVFFGSFIFAYDNNITMDASAKKKSVEVVMMALGAVPARIASSKTAVVVDEPRVNGMASTVPFAFDPESGCLRSVISPLFQS